MGLVGLGMVSAAVLMVLVAVPRGGEVVWFLRGRDGRQTTYMIVLILLFFLGSALIINSWS
jgi:hypothetical protein